MTCQRGQLPFSSAGKTSAEQRQSQFWLGWCTERAHSRNCAKWLGRLIQCELWPAGVFSACFEQLFTKPWASQELDAHQFGHTSGCVCQDFLMQDASILNSLKQQLPTCFKFRYLLWRSQKLTKSTARGVYSFELALMRQMKPSLICGFSSLLNKCRIRAVLPEQPTLAANCHWESEKSRFDSVVLSEKQAADILLSHSSNMQFVRFAGRLRVNT